MKKDGGYLLTKCIRLRMTIFFMLQLFKKYCFYNLYNYADFKTFLAYNLDKYPSQSNYLKDMTIH